MQDELSELNKKITTLEELQEPGEEEPKKLKDLKAKRAALLAKSGSAAPGEDAFELDMDEDELAGVATGFSNRPVAGEYTAEIGYPDKDYSDKSMKIPFTILDEGPWKGFDQDAFYPGKAKEAAFSIKNVCESAGVKAQTNPKTKKAFYPLMQLAGKKILVVYKDRTSSFVGNDGVEREVTRAKVAHAKPYREKPQTLI